MILEPREKEGGESMAFAPPSYQAAAYRRLWIIVAPYVHLSDLYAACLVCRQWHQVFAPLLWGAPASRFGNDSNSVYCKSSSILGPRVPSFVIDLLSNVSLLQEEPLTVLNRPGMTYSRDQCLSQGSNVCLLEQGSMFDV